jgi:DoxX-like family
MSMNVLGEPVSMRDQVLSRLVGGLIILCLVVDGASKLVPWPAVIEAMDRIGYGSSDALARALGAITTACIALTTIPPTSIVGAILWTSYLGNALVTHLSIV